MSFYLESMGKKKVIFSILSIFFLISFVISGKEYEGVKCRGRRRERGRQRKGRKESKIKGEVTEPNREIALS